MTVLDWLKASERYTFEDGTFEKIAAERGCDIEADAFDAEITQRQRDLMLADIIFTAVLLSPSNTASLSQSHNGYQKVIGQEQDTYRKDKLKFALAIYKKYDDEKAELLEAVVPKIRFIPIVDVDKL